MVTRYLIVILTLVVIIISGCIIDDKLPIEQRVHETVVSKVQYKHDINIRGMHDYWQSPKETLDIGFGDCEDFAILQATILHNEYNVPKDQLRYGYYTSLTEEHLVLVYDGKIIDYDGIYDFTMFHKNKFVFKGYMPYDHRRMLEVYSKDL